ncbi:MAG: hypothetical protein NC177_07450 [Ruminococcus flavefaciens]|nr:hypothetical protein [Ruminococcus flavefaciens]
MSYEEVVEMIHELCLPSAYHHFSERENPSPPFLLWDFSGENNFSADDKVYFSTKELEIELYTLKKSPAVEHEVEAVLRHHKIFYTKNETWIKSEKLYAVSYKMEV